MVGDGLERLEPREQADGVVYTGSIRNLVRTEALYELWEAGVQEDDPYQKRTTCGSGIEQDTTVLESLRIVPRSYRHLRQHQL